jgi:hypothetical protein
MRILYVLFCAALSILSIQNVYADDAAYTGPLTIEGVKKFVTDHGISTPEDLLSRLPARIRENFTLIHDSHSLQAKCADEKNPRILMFSVQDRFVMAFTNKKSPAECLDPEMMQSMPDGSIHFESIKMTQEEFSHKAGQKAVSCSDCHNPSPKWKSYPRWDGNYGSSDDFLDNGPGEKDLYEENIEDWRSSGIYRFLAWKGTPYFPYSTQRQQDLALRPNFRMGLLLARLNGIQMAGKVLKNDAYNQQHAQFLSEHLNCGSPGKEKYKEPSLSDLGKFGLGSNDSEVEYDGYNEPINYTFVELMKAEAHDRSDLQALLEPVDDDTYSSDDYAASFNGLQAISRSLEDTQLYHQKKLSVFCGFLAQEKDHPVNLSQIVASGAPTAQTVPGPTAQSQSPLSRCVSCHQQNSMGPPISFGDETLLGQELHKSGYRHGTLYDEIVYRTSKASAPEQMPFGSSLNKDTELPAFLEHLSCLDNPQTCK